MKDEKDQMGTQFESATRKIKFNANKNIAF